MSQKKVSDKIFPRRLPNGRGLRTNFQLNCEASLKTWSFPQKSSSKTSGKQPGVRRQSLRLVRSQRLLGSRRGKILSETFFWDTLYIFYLLNLFSELQIQSDIGLKKLVVLTMIQRF